MRLDPIPEINHKKLYKKYEPFILEQQAVQVFYAKYPGAKRDRADWWAVCKTVPRYKIEEHWSSGATAYQPVEVDPPMFFGGTGIEDMPIHLGDPSSSNDFLDEDIEHSENEEDMEHSENEEETCGSSSEYTSRSSYEIGRAHV